MDMGDLLDQPVLEQTTLPAALALVDQLRSELSQLRDQFARLQRENLGLKQQVGFWRSMHSGALERLEAAKEERDQLAGENLQLKADLFGRRSEKSSAADRSNDLEDPQANRPVRRRGQQPQRPGPKRRDYSHLPIREELIELPEDQRRCSCCGQEWAACGTEDSEQIEIETQVYRRVIRRRRYRRTCDCSGPLTRTAPTPAKLIPKSLFGTSVWVEILLDKFATHRPTQRLLKAWELLDFDVAAGTITEGLHRLTPLFAGLYEIIRQRNGLSPVVQADETRWKVFEIVDGKTGHTWWLWVFIGKDTIVYLLDMSRSSDTPEDHLGETIGKLVVDRYSAYKALQAVKDGRLILAFCWAHVRRDFVRVGKGWPERKDWALAWLRRIRALYTLNRQRLAAPTDSGRQMALRDAVAAMQRQYQAELAADSSIGIPARKVLVSLDEHWQGLTHFVDDPRIPMDNNLSERSLRGAALGRKNYYGSVSQWSGQLAAMMFTLLATLPMWGINPRRWLAWYLESCAQAGGEAPANVASFLPWNITPEKLQELRQDPAPPDLDPDTS
jgi:transposase